MKVVTIVGTRPEIIRLSRRHAALDRHMEHVLVHTGQNYDYELNQIFFEDLGLRQPGPLPRGGRRHRGRDHRPGDRRGRRRCCERSRPDARPDPGRHQQLPGGHRRQAPQDPRVPHGGRQPLLRRARARGDQPPDRRPYQRHQPALQRHLPRVPAARRVCPPTASSRPAARCTRCSTTTCRRSRPPMSRSAWGWRPDGYFVVSATARRTSTTRGSSPSTSRCCASWRRRTACPSS